TRRSSDLQSYLLCFLFFSLSLTAQVSTIHYEKYPVFPGCEGVNADGMEQCFSQTLQQFIYDNFEVPNVVAEKNYKGNIHVLFEVTKEGKFKVLYVDGMYEELKTEVNRVFEMLPTVEPATYNASPTYVQFTLPISIPLIEPGKSILSNLDATEKDP